jgi:enterochelin esterase-like enzyme
MLGSVKGGCRVSVVGRRFAMQMAVGIGVSACRKPGPPVGVSDLGRVEPEVDASMPAVASDAAAEVIEEAPYPKTTAKEAVANGELALHDWALPGDAKIGRRAVVLVPTYLPKGARVPLLVLLHGLAETVDEEMGAYAWVKRYGVGEGFAHARAPKTISMASLKKMATEERIAEIQDSLEKKPFRGMVIACPYTPNIWKVGVSVDAALDVYASWLFDVLVPRLRSETPVNGKLGLDGVSLGGYASLGVGVRKLESIDALGCVQAAVSTSDAESWADRIQKAFASKGAKPLSLITSTSDAFRKPVETLSAALKKRAIAHDFRLAIGPHDQPFLRGPGSLEMLLWHDRALA